MSFQGYLGLELELGPVVVVMPKEIDFGSVSWVFVLANPSWVLPGQFPVHIMSKATDYARQNFCILKAVMTKAIGNLLLKANPSMVDQ